MEVAGRASEGFGRVAECFWLACLLWLAVGTVREWFSGGFSSRGVGLTTDIERGFIGVSRGEGNIYVLVQISGYEILTARLLRLM